MKLTGCGIIPHKDVVYFCRKFKCFEVLDLSKLSFLCVKKQSALEETCKRHILIRIVSL